MEGERRASRQYFQSLLYRKEIRCPNAYISRGDRRRFNGLIMRPEHAEQLRNKHEFQIHFSEAPGVRLPRHLGHAKDGRFRVVNGTELPLGSENDLRRALEHMLEDARAHDADSLHAKPVNLSRGRGVTKVTSAEPEPELWRAMQERGCMFQQTVEQHPVLAAVAPDTLNTMRITTWRLGGGEPVVASV